MTNSYRFHVKTPSPVPVHIHLPLSVPHQQLASALATPRGPAARSKVGKVLHEWKAGGLHSGSKKGPLVKSKAQALAIALSQARKAGQA